MALSQKSVCMSHGTCTNESCLIHIGEWPSCNTSVHELIALSLRSISFSAGHFAKSTGLFFGMMLLILLLCGSICVSRYVYMYIHTYVCKCLCVAVSWYDAADHVAVWQYMCQYTRIHVYTHRYLCMCVLLSSCMMLLIVLLCGSIWVGISVYMYIHAHVCFCVCVAVFWFDSAYLNAGSMRNYIYIYAHV